MQRGRYWAHMSDVTQLLIPTPTSRDLSWQQLTCWVVPSSQTSYPVPSLWGPLTSHLIFTSGPHSPHLALSPQSFST